MKPQYINMSEENFTEMCEELAGGGYVAVIKEDDGELSIAYRAKFSNRLVDDIIVLGEYDGEYGFDGDDEEKIEIAAEWAEKSILHALEGKE